MSFFVLGWVGGLLFAAAMDWVERRLLGSPRVLAPPAESFLSPSFVVPERLPPPLRLGPKATAAHAELVRMVDKDPVRQIAAQGGLFLLRVRGNA